MKRGLFVCFICVFSTLRLFAQPVPYPNGATGELEPFVHDPVIAEEYGTFYMFHTGPGINVWKSEDLKHWDTMPSVFPKIPEHMHDTIPGFSGHLWAPDIYHHNGTWYLYYSVSAFGKNTSFIGVATNKTLDATSDAYEWCDHGLVIQSFPGQNNWNAIDANIIDDEDGNPWMSFGSFWGGLQIVRLAEDRLSLLDPENPEILSIASRVDLPDEMPAEGYPVDAGDGAIEAPFIIRRGDYYYLFASVDLCCRGADSTYKMIIGRSKSVTGPYIDEQGVSLNDGGGTILLAGDERWYGVGHNGILNHDGTDYIVYHAYDSENSNAWARLQIKPLKWEAGWPAIVMDK